MFGQMQSNTHDEAAYPQNGATSQQDNATARRIAIGMALGVLIGTAIGLVLGTLLNGIGVYLPLASSSGLMFGLASGAFYTVYLENKAG